MEDRTNSPGVVQPEDVVSHALRQYGCDQHYLANTRIVLASLEAEGFVIVDTKVYAADDLTAALRDWLAYTRAPSGVFGQSIENTMAYDSTRRLRAAAAKHLASDSGRPSDG